MKKFLSVLLVLCMVLGMAACGSSDTPVAETAPAATSDYVPSPESDGSMPYGSGFIVNVDTMEYHLPGCDYTVDIENIALFDAEVEDMASMNFTPCVYCKPDVPPEGKAVG